MSSSLTFGSLDYIVKKCDNIYMSRRSRLIKSQEKKAIHKIVFSLVGIVVIIFILIKVAIPALINFSLFIASVKSGSSTNAPTNSPNFIMSPILSPTFSATNSASISISGNAQAKEQVTLFINNNSSDTIDTKKDGSFVFSNVTLSPGVNTFYVKAKIKDKTSGPSETISITYQNSAPNLTIDTPHDGDTIHQATVTVSGKTDPDNKVTVNGFWAIINADGQYSYSLSLQNGGNQIKVVSQDPAGNQTEKDLSVKRE